MRGPDILLEWDEDVHCADCSVYRNGVGPCTGFCGARAVYVSLVLPSLISPNGEVYYIMLVYLVLAYLCICLPAVRAYCICDSSRHVISASVLWVLLGVYVSIAVVGFSGELLFAVETLYLDYLCHYYSSISYAPTSWYSGNKRKP